MRNNIFFSSMCLWAACNLQTQQANRAIDFAENEITQYKTIGEIPVPPGFSRLTVKTGSFGEWIRDCKLKRDNRVFLYDGRLKQDQSVQFAVVDMPVGNKDLQQCADAIMRLRAEYFFSKNDFDSIHFSATDGTVLSFTKWKKGIRYQLSGNKLNVVFTSNPVANIKEEFENYLETVFSYAGTTSLARELTAVGNLSDIQPGDVFIKPGFPGHAMIVADLCINKEGEKLFMLAQSYMPAQDIHIVKNYDDEKISPWYRATKDNELNTPEWIFKTDQLKRWK